MPFGAIAGAVGIASSLFGRKKKAPQAPPMPQLGPIGLEAQSMLYPQIQSGLAGEGFFSEDRDARTQAQLDAMDSGFKEFSQFELPSIKDRMVAHGDDKVSSYLDNMVDSARHRTEHGLRSSAELQPYLDQQDAIGMGFDSLASEKQMGTSILNMTNQANQLHDNIPSFRDQILGGIGGAAGWMAGANQNPIQNYSASFQQNRGGF